MNILKLENLTVSIKEKIIVKNVNLEVKKGELHVIIGPNGSGKTTLLASIIGLSYVKICNGKIIFEGKDITNLPSYERAKLGISLAFQNVPNFKTIKLEEIVNEISKKFNSNKKELISILKIENLLSKKLFYEFSGGERKKVEFFLSLLQNPKILLLDEIDSGIDIDTINIFAKIINDLIDKKVTIILITHYGKILEKLKKITKVHLMINGSIVLSGDISIAKEIMKNGYEKFLKKWKIKF
jgi:Fe-S cluster assembly ATP-binding protein